MDGYESLTVFFRPLLVASDAHILLVVFSLSPSPLAVSAVEQLPPLVVYALSPKRWGGVHVAIVQTMSHL